MSETVGEWRERKLAQCVRFQEHDPSLSFEDWQDYATRFVLIHRGYQTALVIGQCAREQNGQEPIDLTDDQIEEWAKPLRRAPDAALARL